jgi:uncharacterized membrane protein YoaK (UPF0700 family)
MAFGGFFVAQATGKYVVAGSELVYATPGFLLKVLAMPVFLAAGMLTAIAARIAERRVYSSLALLLCLEAFLLTGFAVTGSIGDPRPGSCDRAFRACGYWGYRVPLHGCCCQATACSPNVMTTNTTQLSIDLADSPLNIRLALKLLDTAVVMFGFL